MAEALISRSGGINSEILQKIEDLEFKDPSYATIIASLKDPDGNPVPNEKIKISPLDSGSEVEYTTNENGQVLYRTIASQVKLNDSSFPGYYDQVRAIDQTVDSAVGVVYRPNLVRSKSLQNGQNIVLSGSGSIKFSNLVDRFNLNMSAGSGSHCGCAYSDISYTLDAAASNETGIQETTRGLYLWMNIYLSNKINYGDKIGDGEGGNGYNIAVNPKPGVDYHYSIGVGGGKSSTEIFMANNTHPNYGRLPHERPFSKYQVAWKNQITSVTHRDGVAGGTSYFGDYSAIGGRGGNISTVYQDYGFAPGGNYMLADSTSINGRYTIEYAGRFPTEGYHAVITFNEFLSSKHTFSDCHWGDTMQSIYIGMNANMYFSKANDGWCVLENIQYK